MPLDTHVQLDKKSKFHAKTIPAWAEEANGLKLLKMLVFWKFGFSLWWSLSVTSMGQEGDLGQELVRELWHDNDLRVLQSQHYFTDLAETYWLSKQEGQLHQKLSQDPLVSFDQTLTNLLSKPYQFSSWFPPLLQSFRLVFENFWGSLPLLENLFWILFPPLYLLFALICCFRLWILQAAIIPSLPNFFEPYQNFLIIGLFVSLVFWSIYFSLFLISLLILSSLVLCFSKKNLVYTAMTVFIALFLNLSLFWEPLKNTAQELELRQSLRSGRTRIEFSPDILKRLSPDEKAVLSYYNKDSRETQYWLDQSKPSVSKDILQANLLYTGTNANTIILRYEDILSQQGQLPLLLYNLSQLYNQSQELVQAEAMMNKISELTKQELVFRSALLKRQLLPYLEPLGEGVFLDTFKSNLQPRFKQLGLSPFQLSTFLIFILWLLLPWVLIFYALYQRRYVAGLCHLSGMPTTSPAQDLSPYARMSRTSEDIQQAIKIKKAKRHFDHSIRQYSQLQSERALLWSWLLPGSNYLVYGQEWRCFFRSLSIYLFLWIGLSELTRIKILEALGTFPNNFLFGREFFWLPLLLALITYVFFVIESRKRAYR